MSRFGDITIDSLPPHAQAKARAILAGTDSKAKEGAVGPGAARQEPTGPSVSVKPMRVPKAPQMNKTETAFSLRLEALKRDGQIADWKFGAITLQLAPGLRFTPDFAVWEYVTINTYDTHHLLAFYECKAAFVRDDARAKLLMAARAYPWFRFTLAQLIKGTWHATEIAK